MLIRKSIFSYITRNDMPNKNWITDDTKDNYFLVDDNSELGKKILSHCGGIKPVVENGELIDVELIDPPVIPQEPTEAERLEALEKAMLTVIGGI